MSKGIKTLVIILAFVVVVLLIGLIVLGVTYTNGGGFVYFYVSHGSNEYFPNTDTNVANLTLSNYSYFNCVYTINGSGYELYLKQSPLSSGFYFTVDGKPYPFMGEDYRELTKVFKQYVTLSENGFRMCLGEDFTMLDLLQPLYPNSIVVVPDDVTLNNQLALHIEPVSASAVTITLNFGGVL